MIAVCYTYLLAGTWFSTTFRKRMNSWWVWRCMQRPITLPSSTSKAANNVVVPFLLYRPA